MEFGSKVRTELLWISTLAGGVTVPDSWQSVVITQSPEVGGVQVPLEPPGVTVTLVLLPNLS